MTFDFNRFATEHRVSTYGQGRGMKHHVRPGWVGLKCPVCGSEHLGFNLARGYFSCWRCGHLRIVDVIQWLTNVSTEKARQIRWEFDNEKQNRTIITRKVGDRPREAPEPMELESLSQAHIEYLRDVRGLDWKEITDEWDLKGTRHLSGEWSWRVVAPIYDDTGSRTLAYVGRAIGEDVKPKYKMTDRDDCAIDPENLIYGLHKTRGKSVIVLEGPGDVWNIGPGSVASLGIDWSRGQANQLRHYDRRFIMFDPDPKAQYKAQKLAEWLSMFPGDTERIDGLPSDPGSLSDKLVREIRAEFLEGKR